MPRTFHSVDLVQLPRLDAHDAIALASSIEAGAIDPVTHKRDKTLPGGVVEALDDIVTDRTALQGAVAASVAPGTPSGIRQADRREDRAVKALIGLCEAWAELDEEETLGALGKKLLQQIFGAEGRSITQLPVKQEWAVIDSKLNLIRDHKLDASIESLGGKVMLAHLRKVHVEYGHVIGTTRAAAEKDSPEIAARLDALLESMRTFVIRVSGIVSRKKPETGALAERLLRPVMSWESSRGGGKGAKPAGGAVVVQGQGGTEPTAATTKAAGGS